MSPRFSLDTPARLAAAAAFLAAAFLVAASLDTTLATAAAAAPRGLKALGLFVTGFGTSEYMFAYSSLVGFVAVVALGRGHAAWHGGSVRVIAERAAYVFAAVAVSGLVDQALKHLIGRARPVLLASGGPFHFEPLSIANAFASFPSGHTTSAFAAAMALGFLCSAWCVPLLAAAALIGASRVLVGAHYPSDVVGGAALGAVVAAVLAQSFARRGVAFTLHRGRAVAKPLRTAEPRTSP